MEEGGAELVEVGKAGQKSGAEQVNGAGQLIGARGGTVARHENSSEGWNTLEINKNLIFWVCFTLS